MRLSVPYEPSSVVGTRGALRGRRSHAPLSTHKPVGWHYTRVSCPQESPTSGASDNTLARTSRKPAPSAVSKSGTGEVGWETPPDAPSPSPTAEVGLAPQVAQKNTATRDGGGERQGSPCEAHGSNQRAWLPSATAGVCLCTPRSIANSRVSQEFRLCASGDPFNSESERSPAQSSARQQRWRVESGLLVAVSPPPVPAPP